MIHLRARPLTTLHRAGAEAALSAARVHSMGGLCLPGMLAQGRALGGAAGLTARVRAAAQMLLYVCVNMYIYSKNIIHDNIMYLYTHTHDLYKCIYINIHSKDAPRGRLARPRS